MGAGAVRPIAVLQGASSADIQDLLRAFVQRHAASVDIVGVVETTEDREDGTSRTVLGDIRGDRLHRLFQDLGPGSAACGLDPEGVAGACQSVCRQVQAGCELVVLTKFAQLEADRGGLAPAFAAAIEAGVPILTAVSPKFAAAWDRFADPLYEILPPTAAAIDAWWRAASTLRRDEPASPAASAI